MDNDYQAFESDVLVIGAGMAGLMAAIRARDFAKNVILVEKAKVARSSVTMFCHAFGAPVPDNVFEPLLKECVERSGYMADQSWFEVFLRESGDRVRDMENWGVIFEKDENGNLKIDRIRGQRIKASALAEGKQLTEALSQEARRRGVQFVERVAVLDLLTSDGKHPTNGHVIGAVGMHTTSGQFVVFKSPAVVLASGSMSPKLHYAYMDNVTGDGYAMAFRAGADMVGMEYAPIFTFNTWNRQFCTGGQGQFQHEGSRLVNRLGEEFLKAYSGVSKTGINFEGHDDFGDLCRAMAIENLEGRGPVYFDLKAWTQEKIDKMWKVLPFTMMAFDEAGIDMKEQLVETTPMCSTYATGCQAGIRTDTLARTTIGGLFAAGAACHYGKGVLPQGQSAVAGYRAGENGAKWARDTESGNLQWQQVEELKKRIVAPLQKREGLTAEQIYSSVNKVTSQWWASLFKEESRISKVLTEIRRIAGEDLPHVKADDIHGLIKANEARNFVQMMELVNISARERRESRTGHYREDYPYRDDRDWLKWIVLNSDGQDGVRMRHEPLPLGSYAILPEKLTKTPSPIQYKMKSS